MKQHSKSMYTLKHLKFGKNMREKHSCSNQRFFVPVETSIAQKKQ